MAHFYRHEGRVWPAEILAKQQTLFWNKLLNCKYGISGIPPKQWSGSIKIHIEYHMNIVKYIHVTQRPKGD